MNETKHIAILGAGPAGLMAAEVLGKAGHTVTLYDRMASPARKFLIAGRGGLNLTHSEDMDTFLTRYGEASSWLSPSIHAFPPSALRAWCEGLGVETFVGTSGRIFPRSMKAVQLLRLWLRRLESLGIKYKPRHAWQGWENDSLSFETPQGKVLVKADATILALGGASWPRLGSNGVWVNWLSSVAEVAPLRPSNSGFVAPWSEYFSSRFAGEPLKPVTITHKGVSRQGEAMITAQGIEGGVVYALSSSIREAIVQEGKAAVTLDLRPNQTGDALSAKLDKPRGRKSLSTFLKSAGFAPVAISLLRERVSNERLMQAKASELAGWLKALPLTLTATTGIERAISSAGGITRESCDAHFMLLKKPGVFVAGEMLDWEAPTGGYLLQGCFSTAVAAAEGVLRYLEKH
ncbi:MAG: TIGR03862 family flavoprotein [Proteobacteria bacterium]|nr:TIGR03862 family flavoprotein [Pseudomonadota bacterium]